MQIGGGLSRDRRPACARCTWPRSSRRRDVVSRSRARRARPTASCATTSAARRRHDPSASAPRVVAELPTGRSCAKRAARSRRTCSSRLDEYLRAVRGGRATRPAARCTGRATRPRRTRSCSSVARAHGATEVVKVKSLTTDEIRPQRRRSPPGGIHAIETDFAELILQLDGDRSSHILVPAIHRNRREIRDLFAAHDRAGRRAPRRPARACRGGAACTCASSSCAPRSASAARTSASPRPARSSWSSRRATGACARRCRRCSSPCSASRSSCRASPTSRSSSSCCRARRPASG